MALLTGNGEHSLSTKDEVEMDNINSKLDESSDDDSDSSENEQDSQRLAVLERQLSENLYEYDLHIELIQLLRQTGELDRLREARERMSQTFPLTDKLWLEWIEDEKKLISADEERNRILHLFERAVKDYMSVDLWLEYVQCAIGGMAQAGGIEKIRQLFENALTAVGLHTSKGSLVWEAYREFENAILQGLQPAPGSVPTEEQEKQLQLQTKRILALFQRQLALPLINMDQTLSEYTEWCDEGAEHEVKLKYERAQNMLQKLQKYEESLESAKPPRLEAYEEYIKFELEQDNPARIQCLFERSLAENCLVSDLWLQYTKYLDSCLKVKSVILDVYERSVRNCPWSADLWLGYLRALERHGCSHDRILEVFDRALGVGFSHATDYLLIWTGYCDYLRRRIKWDEEHSAELEDLRLTFDKAITYLEEAFPADGDPNCTLLQFWARLEAKYCHNMEKVRELWNHILQLGFANQAQSWLDYFNLERAFGDHKHCRKILQRALNSASDWPEGICEAYLTFEREEGTLEQYDQAVGRCEAQMKRINERRAQIAQKEEKLAEQKKEQRKWREKQKKNTKKEHLSKQQKEESPVKDQTQDSQEQDGFPVPSAPPVYKRKGASLPQPTAKKARGAPSDHGRDDQLRPPSDSQPHITLTAPPGAPPGAKGAPTTVSTTRAIDNEEQMQTEPSTKHFSKPVAEPDKTVFVSNLDYKVAENALKDIFSRVGDVTEVRLVKNFQGRSKGYAYVELDDELAAAKALTLDRTPVEGRPMYVSRCEDKTANPTRFKYSTDLEKTKLFVRGLPFTTTKEALQTIFGQHGVLKDVRIVTNRSGKPKGLAYVEYDNEVSAAQAVLKTDGLEIGDHTISVAISNPPVRKQPISQREAFVPTLGSGKKDFGMRGKARTQVAMVPRAVQKPVVEGNQSQAAKSSATSEKGSQNDPSITDKPPTAGKMSNEDFRKMLLK